jgi:hypothetical protein
MLSLQSNISGLACPAYHIAIGGVKLKDKEMTKKMSNQI